MVEIHKCAVAIRLIWMNEMSGLRPPLVLHINLLRSNGNLGITECSDECHSVKHRCQKRTLVALVFSFNPGPLGCTGNCSLGP